jgi:DNA-binding beta-propeller fold protein YncE
MGRGHPQLEPEGVPRERHVRPHLRQAGGATGSFNWPLAIAVRPGGNMYVADGEQQRSRSFSPTLAFPLEPMGRAARDCRTRRPSGLVFDPVGNRILVADTTNARIVALAASARLSILPTTRSRGWPSRGRRTSPSCAGHIGSRTLNYRVQRFGRTGPSGIVIGGGENHQMSSQTGGVDEPNSLLYVADTFNDRIQVYSA